MGLPGRNADQQQRATKNARGKRRIEHGFFRKFFVVMQSNMKLPAQNAQGHHAQPEQDDS